MRARFALRFPDLGLRDGAAVGAASGDRRQPPSLLSRPQWDGVGDTYSIAQHVDDVIAFLEKLDLGPVDLMGHSRGGHICFRVGAGAAGPAPAA